MKYLQEQILEKVIIQYDLYKEQTIAYEPREGDSYKGIYFKEMYQEYQEQYTEKEFANMLYISNENFTDGLRGSRNRAKILRKRTIKEEERETLREEIKRKYQLKEEITYSVFLEIYQELKSYFTQKELSRVFRNVKRWIQQLKSRKNKAD